MTTESGWCEIKRLPGRVAVLELHREHDLATLDEMTSAFDALSAEEGDVVLDLARTTFLDSAAIHAIYGFAARQTAGGRRLVLRLGSESAVHRALVIAGLLEHVPWADTLEDAVALLERS